MRVSCSAASDMTRELNRLVPRRIGPRESELSDRQRTLLDRFEAIILRDGFSQLTVGELASQLHCSRRTLYELAPTKDELILTVLDRWLWRIGQQTHDALARSSDPIERLRLGFGADGSGLRAATLRFYEDAARHPPVQRLINTHYRYATARMGVIIAEGIGSGQFRPVNPQLLAYVIDAAVERVQLPEVERATGLTFTELVDELFDIICQGIISSQR